MTVQVTLMCPSTRVSPTFTRSKSIDETSNIRMSLESHSEGSCLPNVFYCQESPRRSPGANPSARLLPSEQVINLTLIAHVLLMTSIVETGPMSHRSDLFRSLDHNFLSTRHFEGLTNFFSFRSFMLVSLRHTFQQSPT